MGYDNGYFILHFFIFNKNYLFFLMEYSFRLPNVTFFFMNKVTLL
jgi:hypothetical protein